ncbi:MAG TPA: dihydrolipoamide acetyltransferase family protein [Gemmatimonadales bacterium]
MATKVVMEALSPTMEEGRVINWLKAEGDVVKAGETLAEVETDKAVMELVARGEGVLRKILTPAGTTVEVGKLVAVIAGKDEDISGVVGREPKAEAATPKTSGTAPDASAIPSAPGHRPSAIATSTTDVSTGRVKASPLARRIAKEQGVNLGAIQGTGPGGRIIRRDLSAAPTSSAPSVPSVPSGGWRDVPLTQIRKTIAKRLAQSLGPVPHFFLTSEIDMEQAAEAREALNALGEGKVSFNDIIIKVVATALTQHSACNAWWQDDHIRYFADAHIGMAVAVEDGLITPVIRQAQVKSLRAISTEARDLAERARARKLKPDEYTGSTFSLSNLGMLDIDEFTAVINPPEAGIIAIGAIVAKPVAHGGQVVIRRRMRLTMSCDHRVIDGATGAKFLQTVKRMLENPMAMVW